jgi:hypothetical protein
MKLKEIYLELDIYLNEWYRCLPLEGIAKLWGNPRILERPNPEDFKDDYDLECAEASYQDMLDEYDLDWFDDHIYNRVMTHDEMHDQYKEYTKDVIYGRELEKFLESLKNNS